MSINSLFMLMIPFHYLLFPGKKRLFRRLSREWKVQHNFIIILLLGSKAKTCCLSVFIQTKMYRLYVSIKSILFWDPSLNRVISKIVLQRTVFIWELACVNKIVSPNRLHYLKELLKLEK